MATRTTKLWASLLQTIDGDVTELSSRSMLRAVQLWLRSNLEAFEPLLRQRYGLSELCALDLLSLPVERAGMNSAEEVEQLRRLKPRSMETFAMRLRDLFWAFVVMK